MISAQKCIYLLDADKIQKYSTASLMKLKSWPVSYLGLSVHLLKLNIAETEALVFPSSHPHTFLLYPLIMPATFLLALAMQF